MNLIKTLRFDDDVLTEIKNMRWSDDGLEAVITTELDRKMYQRVNKALEAMGGSWNRKAKAHLFQSDPRKTVEGLLESGTLKVAKDGFFETPESVIELMLERSKLLYELAGKTILEPSAGEGKIAKFLRDRGADVVCIEKDAGRAALLISEGFIAFPLDFLTFRVALMKPVDAVVMNPPFEQGQDVDHVRHALQFVKTGGTLVSIMSEHPFFATDQKSKDFRHWFDLVNGNWIKVPNGAFKESGTGVNTRIIVIKK